MDLTPKGSQIGKRGVGMEKMLKYKGRRGATESNLASQISHWREEAESRSMSTWRHGFLRGDTCLLRCCFKDLVILLQVFVQFQNGRHISTSNRPLVLSLPERAQREGVNIPVTVIGSRPNRHDRVFEHEFVALHNQLMGSCDQFNVIYMGKLSIGQALSKHQHSSRSIPAEQCPRQRGNQRLLDSDPILRSLSRRLA